MYLESAVAFPHSCSKSTALFFPAAGKVVVYLEGYSKLLDFIKGKLSDGFDSVAKRD
jgi:hypothetical protein